MEFPEIDTIFNINKMHWGIFLVKQYSIESCSVTGKFYGQSWGCYLMAMHQWRAPELKLKNNIGICFQEKG